VWVRRMAVGLGVLLPAKLPESRKILGSLMRNPVVSRHIECPVRCHETLYVNERIQRRMDADTDEDTDAD